MGVRCTTIGNKQSQASVAYHGPSQDNALSVYLYGAREPPLERHGSQTLLQSPHADIELLLRFDCHRCPTRPALELDQ